MQDPSTVTNSIHSSDAAEPTALSTKPGYLLLITVATIFIMEALEELVFDNLQPMPGYQEAILDAILWFFIVFPMLYFLAFRPLGRHILLRAQAEAEKDRLIGELQTTLAQLKTLEGIIPICASCKKIRDDEGFWHKVETYISDHSEALFTHGICPDCENQLVLEAD